jgi:type II secretory pathway component GspD/PulD (secretin)
MTLTLRKSAQALMALALTLIPLGFSANAQDKPVADNQPAAKSVDACGMRNSSNETKTFYLANVGQQRAANEIMVAIRNMICPGAKVYFVESQNALVIQAPADQLALAQKLIHELDRPTKTYRLTYTVTELDAGKTVGTQHYSMVVVSGQHTSMKEGDKIPVATGSYSAENSSSQTQFQYLDIGMNFGATVNEVANGVRLESKVEQSSVGQPQTIAGVQEPVVRQTVLESTSLLTLDKPVMLGSIDVPNSTRHFDIAVVAELVK